MNMKTTRISFGRTLAIGVVGLTLFAGAAPAASAAGPRPAPVAVPMDSGSASGSGYVLNALLNALCAITGEPPTCWGDVPR